LRVDFFAAFVMESCELAGLVFLLRTVVYFAGRKFGYNVDGNQELMAIGNSC